ncbi:MAG TPA: hypothetical protein VKR42_11170 [Ktedonobacteraceae bacterium]|nr:hypothetical protein [Ktedonobacteraceae bacterium]
MGNSVKIVGSGVDTLVMNIYPTDSAGNVIKRLVNLPGFLIEMLKRNLNKRSLRKS